MDEYFNLAQQVARENNAWSAQQAQKQMDFQERLSSSAHQREVADLKAAGLNPVLSAHGNGASSPTGAMGLTDTSVTALIPQLMDLAQGAISSSASSARGLGDVSKSLKDILKKDVDSKLGSKHGDTKGYHSATVDKIKSIASDMEKSLPYKYRWVAGAVKSVADNADPKLVDQFTENPLAYCLSILVPPGETREKVYDRLVEEKGDMVSYFKNIIEDPKDYFYNDNLVGIAISNVAKKKAASVASRIEEAVKKGSRKSNAHHGKF